MTFKEFRSLLRPKPGTTEGTIKSWYKFCRTGTWSSSIKTHEISYNASAFYIKNLSIEEYKEFENIYIYFDRLVKSKLKLKNLKEDFV